MKLTYLFLISAAALLLASCGAGRNAATQAGPTPSRFSQKQVLKQARKEAKTYQKDGFKTFIGGLPLARQLENAWLKTIYTDETGNREYIVTTSRVIGGNVSAARMQALHQSKVEMAGLISSNIASLIESSLANNELSQQESVSINNALQASKELITADLGRVSGEIEIYRDLPNRNVEVMICLSYSSRQALDAAKKNMTAKLEERTGVLQEKLDRLIGLDRFDGSGSNTNLQLDAD
ncbi:MAG: hypothetical protein LBJ58_08670 [Tannerellaceae bacterium]|jgi:hypothetical protein|nr:hypothetical protein [Tannerellaceae bacterium]